MYIIIHEETNRVMFTSSYPVFVMRDPVTGQVFSASYETATGISYKDKLYNIAGTSGVEAEETVAVLEREPIDLAIEVLQKEDRSNAYIDYLSAMTGIDLPYEE